MNIKQNIMRWSYLSHYPCFKDSNNISFSIRWHKKDIDFMIFFFRWNPHKSHHHPPICSSCNHPGLLYHRHQQYAISRTRQYSKTVDVPEYLSSDHAQIPAQTHIPPVHHIHLVHYHVRRVRHAHHRAQVLLSTNVM